MKQETKVKLVGVVGSNLMRLLFLTMRFKITDRAQILVKSPDNPLIWAFWHNRLFVMSYFFERFFIRKGRPGATLMSQSKDGEFIAAIVEQFRIKGIRGSSSRGGARALVEMKRTVNEGSVMAITPDGPRGPRYTVNPGIVKLAQVTQGVIQPVHVEYSSYWQLKSWDGFRIPKPFSTCHVTFEAPHPVQGTKTEEEFEAERVRFEGVMRALEGE